MKIKNKALLISTCLILGLTGCSSRMEKMPVEVPEFTEVNIVQTQSEIDNTEDKNVYVEDAEIEESDTAIEESDTTISYNGNIFDMQNSTYKDFLAFLQNAGVSVTSDGRNYDVDSYYNGYNIEHYVEYKENDKDGDIDLWIYNPYDKESKVKECKLWYLPIKEDLLEILNQDICIGGTLNVAEVTSADEIKEIMESLGFVERDKLWGGGNTEVNNYTKYKTGLAFEKELDNGQNYRIQFKYDYTNRVELFDKISEVDLIITPYYEY